MSAPVPVFVPVYRDYDDVRFGSPCLSREAAQSWIDAETVLEGREHLWAIDEDVLHDGAMLFAPDLQLTEHVILSSDRARRPDIQSSAWSCRVVPAGDGAEPALAGITVHALTDAGHELAVAQFALTVRGGSAKGAVKAEMGGAMRRLHSHLRNERLFRSVIAECAAAYPRPVTLSVDTLLPARAV